MQGRCLSLIAESAALRRAYHEVRATRYGHKRNSRYRLVAQPRSPRHLYAFQMRQRYPRLALIHHFSCHFSYTRWKGHPNAETSLKYFCHCYVPPESDSFMARDQNYRRETRDSTSRAQAK